MPDYCKIKLCGLKHPREVELAVELGVDAVGFVLTPSPRQITLEEARRLAALVPESIQTHGVFGLAESSFVREAMDFCGLDLAQVHGNGDDVYWQELAGVELVRAFRVRGEETLGELEAVRGKTFLLDAYVPGMEGGTGKTFDWSLARRAKEYGRVILAGGLTPGNVAEAIRAAAPWMVDVSGGIELEKGVKDLGRMRAFVEAVRGTA